MSDITKAEKVYVSTSKNGDYVSAVDDGDSVAFIRADLVPQWQPIETAPKDGAKFLAYEKRDVSHYPCWWNNDFQEWIGWQDDWDSEPEPTHWQPLPTPPPAT